MHSNSESWVLDDGDLLEPDSPGSSLVSLAELHRVELLEHEQELWIAQKAIDEKGVAMSVLRKSLREVEASAAELADESRANASGLALALDLHRSSEARFRHLHKLHVHALVATLLLVVPALAALAAGARHEVRQQESHIDGLQHRVSGLDDFVQSLQTTNKALRGSLSDLSVANFALRSKYNQLDVQNRRTNAALTSKRAEARRLAARAHDALRSKQALEGEHEELKATVERRASKPPRGLGAAIGASLGEALEWGLVALGGKRVAELLWTRSETKLGAASPFGFASSSLA